MAREIISNKECAKIWLTSVIRDYNSCLKNKIVVICRIPGNPKSKLKNVSVMGMQLGPGFHVFLLYRHMKGGRVFVSSKMQRNVFPIFQYT